MDRTYSKSLRFVFAFNVALWLLGPHIIADEARFFRVVGPTATTITGFNSDGYLTWTNAQIGTNYTVQTARKLGDATNWVDYVQIPASNSIITHRLYDPNPPSNMMLIPAGSFTMGNCMDPAEGHSYELPLHTVYVSAFYMDKYPVTYSLWDTVKSWNGRNGYSYDNAGSGKASTHPVQRVNWYDCVKWCNARSQMEVLEPCYYTDSGMTAVYKTGQAAPYVKWTASGYRLPTEAEWEKAARGGASGQRFPWGNTISWSQANYYSSWSGAAPYYPYDVNPTSGYNPAWISGGTPYTTPVGTFAPNGYGLYDMAGNVLQWCWDWYGSYSSGAQTDPRGPATGSIREYRGGAWCFYASDCRTAHRYSSYQVGNNDYYGFRSVLPAGQP